MQNVTVGITTYNLLNFSKETIESILNFVDDYDYHLAIVDDCSTDGSQEYFKLVEKEYKKFPRVKSCTLDLHEKNLGAPRSWNDVINIGATNNSDLILILNNDIIVGKNWLSNMVKFMKENPKTVGSSHVIDAHNYNFKDQNEWFRHTQQLYEKEWDITDEGMHGCCIALTPDCVMNIGEFDEGYERTSYEDCDYVVRAYKVGYKALVTHKSIIFHYGGKTQTYMTEHEGGNGFQQKNRFRFEQKWNVNLGGYVCSRAMFWLPRVGGGQDKLSIYG